MTPGAKARLERADRERQTLLLEAIARKLGIDPSNPEAPAAEPAKAQTQAPKGAK